MSVISVKVNGHKVDIFDSDSNDTFLKRVASILRLHPNFLEEIDIDKLKNGDSLKIDTLSNEIHEYKYDTDNVNNNVDFMSGLSQKYNKNSSDTIIKLFLSINPFFNTDISDEFSLLELIPLEEALKNSDVFRETGIDITNFLKKDDITMISPKDEFMKDIKQRINISIQEANSLLAANKEFADMKSINLSGIEVKKDESELKLVTNLNKSNYSLSTIFSNMLCMMNTPFLTYNNLYKVYQELDMKIPDDWSNSFTDFMILKINIDDEKYTDCFILFENDNLTLNIDVKYSSFTYFSEEQIREIIKNRVVECFSNFSGFSITSEKEINIYETVMIPKQKFYTYILSDIILNNNIFSKFLAINESIQTTKKKSGLYVHYFLKNDKGTCNITSVIDGDEDLVRLRIKKAKNEDVIREFINLVGKLLYFYKKSENGIIEFYRNYISKFPKENVKREVLEQTKQNLQKQVPDLFISGYPYKCQYPPVIITDEEAKEYPPERVMNYPIKGEGKSHNYLCNDEKNGYIYVGLRDNTLKNRKRYKYIPCCFKSDQTKRRGPYQEYFKGDIVEKGPQQNIIITNKLVRNEEYGVLPRNIDKLLSTFDDSYNYLRKGVNVTGLSFLECVLEGALDIAEYSALPQSSKLQRLEKEYNKLKNYKYISIASQENPNKSEEKMRMDIESQKDTYLDPLQWIKLCEVIYKCKIILFSRNQGERDGIVTIPNHELVYLQEKFKEQKLLLIYEHFGTELDLEYPKCELIIKWDSELSIDEGSTNYFSGSISKNIYSFYTSLINQYYYGVFKKELNSIPLFDLIELNSLKPSGQIIDNYGKSRGIFINDILLLSDPFPPIKAERYTDNYYKVNDLKSVMDFINRNNIKIVSQIIVDEEIREINIVISGIFFTAKIKAEQRQIDNIDIDIIEKYPQTNNDLKYNIFMKRLAFVLSEYFNYYYSYFRSSNNKDDEDNDLESIKSFIESKVKVINSPPQYIVPLGPSISLNILSESNFTEGLKGKFLVENSEVLKRLVYSLRVQLFNNRSSIINYYKNKEVYNFYKETRHFSENPLNIIVKDIDDLEKVDNTIYERLRSDKNKFFMHNDMINDGRPILLEKTDSKNDAFLISSNWIKNGKIYGYHSIEPLDNQILYLYKSTDDIKVKRDIIFKTRDNSYALKYKKEDENHYMGLVNL